MFGGSGSIELGRPFGIRVGADYSLFFILFLIIWSYSGYYSDRFPGSEMKTYALAVATAFLFFGSILLHELGHALEARRSGIGIAGIDLWLFGGVAKMERDTRSAGEELRVSAAGPAVTLMIAAISFAALAILDGTGGLLDTVFRNATPDSEAVALIGTVAFLNSLLLVFNMIPGFPLDGGRIARAIAWWRTGDRARATRFAARLGRLFAMLMIGIGILLAVQGALLSGVWLAFIGWFLNQAAQQAELQTVLTSHIEDVLVSDVMDAEPVAVPAELTLDRAWEEFFLRYRWPWFPVIDADGRFVGLVTEAAVESLPEAARGGRTVASVMAADIPGDELSSLRVLADEPLESLLGRDGLQRLGAVIAVDADGRLRGIVTAQAVRRALQPPAPA